MEVVCRQAYRGFKSSMLLRLETARTSIAKLDRQHVDAVWRVVEAVRRQAADGAVAEQAVLVVAESVAVLDGKRVKHTQHPDGVVRPEEAEVAASLEAARVEAARIAARVRRHAEREPCSVPVVR